MVNCSPYSLKGTIMGNRSNIGIRQRNANVLFLYQHWTPEHFFAQIADALDTVKRLGRENDESYANKIFVQVIDPSGILINEIDDNEHKIPVINFDTGTIALYKPRHPSEGSLPLGERVFTMSIDQFINKYARKLVA